MSKEDMDSKEVLKRPEQSYSFAIMRPGGNDTALMKGIIRDAGVRREMNDTMLGIYQNVEQVGFINLDPENLELMMAGGEFCGNATRATAYLALGGNPGEVQVKVSGVEGKLRAGVTVSGEAFAQMPIYSDISKIRADGKNKIVEMEGITQYINFDTDEIKGLTESELKQKAKDIILAKNLDQYPAAGVIWSQKDDDGWRITPVVWVKAVDTLYAETACGSGTTALGLVLALQQGDSIKNVPIVQPTGLPIKVSVEFDGSSFGYAQISGPIEKLGEGTLVQKENFGYTVEQITNPKDLGDALEKGGLTPLYKKIFSEAPYFESFTAEEVKGFFEEYRKEGILLLARNGEGVIGFGAAVPLSNVPDIAGIIRVPPEERKNRWYIADLGVKKEFRKKNIGMRLTMDTMDRIRLSGGDVVDLRTSVNNVIALSLYRKLGFSPIPGAIQQVTEFGAPETDKRMFLSKKL